MSTELNRDILLVDNVMHCSPLGGAVAVGFFTITESDVAFIPWHQQELNADSSIAEPATMEVTDNHSYDGLPIKEVIPLKAQELTPSKLSEYIKEMSEKIEGSVSVPLKEVSDVKVGMMSLAIKAGENSFKLNLGIAPKRKKIIRKFLSLHPVNGMASMGAGNAITTGAIPSTKSGGWSPAKLAVVGVVTLVLLAGIYGGDEQARIGSEANSLNSPEAEMTPEQKIAQIKRLLEKSKGVIMKADEGFSLAKNRMEQLTALKEQSDSLYADIKKRMVAGEKKEALKTKALELKNLKKTISDLEVEVCSYWNDANSWGVESQDDLIKANTMLLELADDEPSRKEFSDNIESAKAQKRGFQSKTGSQFDNC